MVSLFMLFALNFVVDRIPIEVDLEGGVVDAAAGTGCRRRMWLCTMTSGDDEDFMPCSKEVEEDEEEGDDRGMERGNRVFETRRCFLIGSSAVVKRRCFLIGSSSWEEEE